MAESEHPIHARGGVGRFLSGGTWGLGIRQAWRRVPRSPGAYPTRFSRNLGVLG